MGFSEIKRMVTVKGVPFFNFISSTTHSTSRDMLGGASILLVKLNSVYNSCHWAEYFDQQYMSLQEDSFLRLAHKWLMLIHL